MPNNVFPSVPYCYFIKYREGAADRYELFIVVPRPANKKVHITPPGSTLTVKDRKAEITVETLDEAGAPEAYDVKRYDTIVLSNDFDPARDEVQLTVTGIPLTKRTLSLLFDDADDIGSLGAIRITGSIAHNCPYVYLHSFKTNVDNHLPRMLVSRLGYDYQADDQRETPDDTTGVPAHVRTVLLLKNDDHDQAEWLSPRYLNADTHLYRDADPYRAYVGEVEYNGGGKRKGKVKNSSHPVQPGKLMQNPGIAPRTSNSRSPTPRGTKARSTRKAGTTAYVRRKR